MIIGRNLWADFLESPNLTGKYFTVNSKKGGTYCLTSDDGSFDGGVYPLKGGAQPGGSGTAPTKVPVGAII
jgi:hypothetical protein